MEEDILRPLREVRASFDEHTVRVYQAYGLAIAEPALEAQTFVAPFKRERMTWIKPSFTWMMYRSGWGTKADQEVVLGIDVRREGFEWALANACLSHFELGTYDSREAWQKTLETSPVRIQWDPERTLALEALPHRAIQVGIGGSAVEAYLRQWIVRIEDMRPTIAAMQAARAEGDLARAEALRPIEVAYPLSAEIAGRVGIAARAPTVG